MLTPIVVWAVLTHGTFLQPPAAPMTPDQFLDRLDRATEAITTYDVTLRLDDRVYPYGADGKPTEPRVKVSYNRQVYQQEPERRRVEAFDIGPNGAKTRSWVMVLDGESTRVHQVAANEGVIDVTMDVPISDGLDYIGFYRNATGDYELPRVLRNRTGSARVDRVPGSPSLLRFAVDPVREKNTGRPTDRYGYEITLDPDKNFFPSKIRVTVEAKAGGIVAHHETRVEAFHALGGGLFVPQKVVTVFYRLFAPPFGVDLHSITAEVDVAASRWNAPVKPAEFRLGFPVGCRVVDMHKKTQFVSGSDDPGEECQGTRPCGLTPVFR